MLDTLSQIQQLTYFSRHKTLAVLLGGTESPHNSYSEFSLSQLF